MKTAEEVLQFYFNWSLIKDDNFKDNVVNAMKEYAKEVAMEALKNASENATTEQGYCSDGWTPSVRIVDKWSILKESNIPKL